MSQGSRKSRYTTSCTAKILLFDLDAKMYLASGALPSSSLVHFTPLSAQPALGV